jgi:hypothetical protein
MANKKILMALAGLCISASLCADVYSDRLMRMTNTIANEYDASANMDIENITSAALQTINFITVENDISKNSPLGFKNKYITKHAQTLKTIALELRSFVLQIEKIANSPSKKIARETMLRNLWKVEVTLKQLEGEIEEINKKQLLPLSKVQKDLVNLLALLAAKNLALTQRVIRNVEKI